MDSQAIHSWKILVEETFQARWDVGIVIQVNEEKLQIMFLLLSVLLILCVVCWTQIFNILTQALLVPVKCWPKIKTAFVNYDGFSDRHARHVTGGEEKQTLLGGYTTFTFFVMSWALSGIVIQSFLSYNESVVQTLVPKTGSANIRTNLRARIIYLGYTGLCPPETAIKTVGARAHGKELKSVNCGLGEV
jgi:hypothetical protein